MRTQSRATTQELGKWESIDAQKTHVTTVVGLALCAFFVGAKARTTRPQFGRVNVMPKPGYV